MEDVKYFEDCIMFVALLWFELKNGILAAIHRLRLSHVQGVPQSEGSLVQVSLPSISRSRRLEKHLVPHNPSGVSMRTLARST